MAVRRIGLSDSIVMNPGAAASIAAGPWTVAHLMKRNQGNTNATAIMAFVANGTTSSTGFSNGTYTTRLETNANGNDFYVGTAADSIPTLPVVNGDGWVVLVATKATGSAAVRYYRYFLTADTVLRANGGSIANGTTPGGTHRFVFGKDEYTNRADIYMAASAVWNVQLTDGQVDELYANRRSYDWLDNSGGAPIAMWHFNQATVSTVTDITGGGADETAIAGTSVITGDDPPSWDYEYGADQTLDPDGAVDDNDWTTPPLWSKINDNSDATVITDTLV